MRQQPPTSAFFIKTLDARLQEFWSKELSQIGIESPSSLPLSRIKRIMKTSESKIRMISGDAPVVMAKAVELFIRELTIRSWMLTEEAQRKTLQATDIIQSSTFSDIYDFLIDIFIDNGKVYLNDYFGSEENFTIDSFMRSKEQNPASQPVYFSDQMDPRQNQISQPGQESLFPIPPPTFSLLDPSNPDLDNAFTDILPSDTNLLAPKTP